MIKNEPTTSCLFTKKGLIALAPIQKFTKIEARVTTGGFATIAQKHEVMEVALRMDYTLDGVLLKANVDTVVLPADSGLQKWAVQKIYLDDIEFILCPESAVIGYRKASL